MEQSSENSLVPSKKQQSWGALLSIIVIVLMIVIGAYYAWRDRANRIQQYETSATAGVQ